MFHKVHIPLNERAMLVRDGKAVRAIGPGRYTLWYRFEVLRWNTDELVFTAPAAVLAKLPADWYQTVAIDAAQRVVVFRDGPAGSAPSSAVTVPCPRSSLRRRTTLGASSLSWVAQAVESVRTTSLPSAKVSGVVWAAISAPTISAATCSRASSTEGASRSWPGSRSR